MSHETVIVRTLLLPCQHTNTITFSLSLRVWHIGLFAYLLNEHLMFHMVVNVLKY